MPSRRLTWTAYLFMVCEGYLIYAIGFITPYLHAELGAPTGLAALPTSVMAAGLIVSGLVARRVLARLGSQATARMWAALMALSAVLLAIPVTMVPILAGSFLYGIAAAGLMVHVNSGLSRNGGGVYIVRANLWSVAGGVAGPLALSVAARTVGWSLGSLLPVPLLLVLMLVLPGSPASDTLLDDRREPPLGRPFWLTWVFLVLCIGAEFSFVAWGSQVATARTGISVDDATAMASLYVIGMVIGRLVLSAGLLPVTRTRQLLLASAALGAMGAAVLWLAATPALSAAGLFLGGLGVAAIYPFGVTLAIAQAPLAPVKASAWLTVASGVAIMVVPLVLGVVAGATTVVGAWTMVLGLLVAGLIVLLLTPRPAVDVPVAEVAVVPG
ncbi:MAG: hypothetical protein WCK58_13775 [Chloroflexota bacterium]